MPAETDSPPSAMTAALDYAGRGWRVLPILPGKKHPALNAWQDAATTDEATITSWFTQLYRDHGVGIATGAESGIWVLDVDDYDSFRALEREHGELPETLTSLTGSGGFHLFFAWPADGRVIRNNASTRLGQGLDVRGVGGQVVAPPTIHPSGKAYEWDASCDEVAQAPEWLLGLVCEREVQLPPSTPREPSGERPGDRWAADTSWEQLLTADGWTLHHIDSRTGEVHWVRPGKDRREGTSATTGYTANDNLKVFTTSMTHAGLMPDEVYTKLGYLAATRFGGDHGAAARHLADNGYRSEARQQNNESAESVDAEEVTEPVGGWDFVDLGPILDGEWSPPKPTIGRRNDLVGLIYPGRVHSISGEPGGGKTWLALHLIAEVIADGGVATLIDYEDTPASALHRLRLLGLPAALIKERFHYVRPDGPLVTKGGRVDVGTIERLKALKSDLVVIDSVGESLAVEGLPPNDDDAVTQWFRRLPRMLAHEGAAVVGLDHVTKSKDDRGLWAIGSQRKLAAIDGAAYGVEVVTAPTRDRDGKVKILCAKDRHGTFQRGHQVAVATIDNVADGVRVTLTAPEDKFRPTYYMEQVSRFLEVDGESSGRQIEQGVEGRAAHIRAALGCLVDEKYVEKTTTQRGSKYTSVTTFRADNPVDNPVDNPTASTASHRVPPKWDAVQEPPESDRVHRVPDPLRSRGPSGTRSEALEDDEISASDADRVPPPFDPELDAILTDDWRL